jgi:hypothetical protein
MNSKSKAIEIALLSAALTIAAQVPVSSETRTVGNDNSTKEIEGSGAKTMARV